MSLKPNTARVIQGETEIEKAVEDVQIGEVLIVKPGESFPVDGVVLEGKTTVDESMLTGESIPVEKGQGDQVIGGDAEQAGSYKVRGDKGWQGYCFVPDHQVGGGRSRQQGTNPKAG